MRLPKIYDDIEQACKELLESGEAGQEFFFDSPADASEYLVHFLRAHHFANLHDKDFAWAVGKVDYDRDLVRENRLVLRPKAKPPKPASKKFIQG